MRRWLVVLLAISLSGCLGEFLTGNLSEPVEAPDFSIRDVDGQTWNLTEIDGVLLLDFMGTWCGPCQRAVPLLADLQEAYPDLTVISVSGTDSEDQLRDFRSQYRADWPHVADRDVVRAYLDAGAPDATMMWPSYAIVVDGELVFYNRGETLPATFTAALDGITTRQAPEVGDDAALPIALAFAIGLASWSSPFLLRHTVGRDTPRPPATWVLPLLIYGGMGILAAWYSRPLSGRVATIAPWLAAAGLLAIAYWRVKGSAEVQIEGKRIDSEAPWRHAAGLWGNTLWYLLPVWGAVLHAAMLRTAPWESLLIPTAMGLGLVAGEASHRWPAAQTWLQARGDRVGWIGAAALIVAAVWNGLLTLR